MALSYSFNPFTGNFDLLSTVTLGAVGSAPNANAASISASQVLTLQPASGSFPGVVTTGSQTIAGAKTFSTGILTNAINGITGAAMVITAATNQNIAVFTPSPGYFQMNDLITFGSTISSNLGITIQPANTQVLSLLATGAGGNITLQSSAGIIDLVTSPTFSSLTASLPLKLNASKIATAAAINLASSEVTGTLPVANGGTGAASQTAYAVLCGGTTSTGAYQSVASVGTSGQVLTSNGAGALPSFQTLSVVAPNQSANAIGVDGFGSSSTSVIRFNNAPAGIGSEITISTSASLGTTFTVSTSGIYVMEGYVYADTANTFVSITKNSPSLTGDPTTIPEANTLAFTRTISTANSRYWVSASNVLQAGDVIRVQATPGVTLNTGSTFQNGMFRITKVANSVASSQTPVNYRFNSYTSAQTLTSANGIVLATGDNYTLTLPAAATVGSGFILTIQKGDGLGANGITIARAGADTIGNSGATSVRLQTQDETFVLVSDGSSKWIITDHTINEAWVSFTPTGSYTTNSTYTGRWRRVGDSVQVQWRVAFSGAPNSPNPCLMNLPANMTMDTSKLLSTTGGELNMGNIVSQSGGSNPFGFAVYSSTTAIALRAHSSAQTSLVDWTGTSPVSFGNGNTITVVSNNLPITNWYG